MAKAATLRTLSDDQLLDELGSAKKELFNLRFSFATGQLDNSAQVAATKRDIARIHTVLREREIAAADAQVAAAGQAGPSGDSARDSNADDAAQGSAAGPAGALVSAAPPSTATTGDLS